jgi:hypothetical protein
LIYNPTKPAAVVRRKRTAIRKHIGGGALSKKQIFDELDLYRANDDKGNRDRLERLGKFLLNMEHDFLIHRGSDGNYRNGPKPMKN